MEKPLYFSAVVYLCGVGLGAGFTYFPLLVLGLVAGGLLVSIRWPGRRGLSKRTIAVGWGGVLLGMVNFQMTLPSHPSHDLSFLASGERVILRGRIDAPLQHRSGSREMDETVVMRMRAVETVREGRSQKVTGRLRLSARGFSPEAEYGDEIEVEAPLRPLAGYRNPGGFDYAGYLERQGVRAHSTLRRPDQVRRVRAGEAPGLRKIFRWREQIRVSMDRTLPLESAAVLQAMIIGESGSLTPEIREAFMASGTTHILSISGSHLGLVAVGVFTVSVWAVRCLPAPLFLRVGRSLTPSQLGALATIPPVVFYAALAGGQTATVRSLLMILVYLGGVILMRLHDPLHALALSALIVSVWDPQAVIDISFQLSYGAALCMILAGRSASPPEAPLKRSSWGASFIRKVGWTFLLSAAAGLGTAPLVAYHFNQFSWAGLIANPVVVPFVGFLIVPLGLASAMAVIATGSDVFPMSGIHEGLIRLLMTLVRLFSDIPGAELHPPSPPAVAIAFLYLAAALFFFFRTGPVQKMAAAALCVFLALPWAVRMFSPGPAELRITFLDVGQGDSALVQFPDGKTLLIDGGGRYGNWDAGRLAVAPYLWDRSVRRIDYLAVTHPQSDHMGGLVHLLDRFEIGEVWTNGARREAEFYRDFIEAVRRNGIPTRTVDRQTPPFRIGRASLSILHPGRIHPGFQDNDRSLVIRLRYGRHSFLFTGDIEETAERELLGNSDLFHVTLLKVPHHGSRSSIDPDFLARLCPTLAVLSSGPSNPYGHPAPETLEAYRLLGTRLYRTDLDGAVFLETDGDRLNLFTRRDFALRAIRWGGGMAAEERGNWKVVLRRWLAVDPS